MRRLIQLRPKWIPSSPTFRYTLRPHSLLMASTGEGSPKVPTSSLASNRTMFQLDQERDRTAGCGAKQSHTSFRMTVVTFGVSLHMSLALPSPPDFLSGMAEASLPPISELLLDSAIREQDCFTLVLRLQTPATNAAALHGTEKRLVDRYGLLGFRRSRSL